MKKKILLSLFAFVFCVPAAVLFSGAVPLPVQKDAAALLPLEQRKAIARGLYGRIELVKSSSAANYKVCITNNSAAADLRVKIVDVQANRPGLWELVEGAADFRVYITKHSSEADLQIQFDGDFPGPTR